MVSQLSSPKIISKYDRDISHLFSRYNINSDSDDNLLSICNQKQININFLIDLINCYNDLTNLNKTNFNNYSVLDLVDYLEKSHDFYLNKRIPEIEQSLNKSCVQQKFTFNLLFLNFFQIYKKDIISHFETEETILFPFCKTLARYSKIKQHEDLVYVLENKDAVLNYMDLHKKNNDEVGDLQKLLLKYSPSNNHLSYFEIFLNQMSIFQKDLKIHAEIEENILMEKIKIHLSNFEIKDV